jgi:molybdate transport system ATP-binding protein
MPMLMITHDPEDARMFGEHVLYLRDGQIDSMEENTALGDALDNRRQRKSACRARYG